MTEIGLEFLPNPSGEAEGLSDAGIETFRDKPFANVARETGQNSRDARRDSALPVLLTYDLISINSREFPDIEEFRSAANRCREKAVRSGNEKDLGFFQRAVDVLSQPFLTALRVSDFNTVGVRGPCLEGNPFHSLAKSDGVSTKENVNSGGSFGIGKNAVFALSEIQTAFFSTRYQTETGSEAVLCMGKTKFVSHRGEDGIERRSKGYWGKKDGFMPLEDAGLLERWMQRASIGTSIFSICMRETAADWRYEMTAAVLINFFCAVERKEMEFEIDDGAIKINQSTLEALFSDKRVLAAADSISASAALETARSLHKCLTDAKTFTITLNVNQLGQVRLQVLLREGLGYTLGVVRNGMYITDNFANFKEPFKRFPLYREFAAIVEPAGLEEGEWFKRLENPRHDQLAAERITEPKLRAIGQRAFESLAGQIRERLRELAKPTPQSSMQLDELSDFFASDEERSWDDEGLETDPRSFKPSPVKPAKPEASERTDKELEELADDFVPDHVPEPMPEPNPEPHPVPPGPTPRPRYFVSSVRLAGERNVIPDVTDLRKRRLFFTAEATGLLAVYVHASGLNTPERIKIIRSSAGNVRLGGVSLNCFAGVRTSVDVTLETPYSGPIEIFAAKLDSRAEKRR